MLEIMRKPTHAASNIAMLHCSKNLPIMLKLCFFWEDRYVIGASSAIALIGFTIATPVKDRDSNRAVGNSNKRGTQNNSYGPQSENQLLQIDSSTIVGCSL